MVYTLSIWTSQKPPNELDNPVYCNIAAVLVVAVDTSSQEQPLYSPLLASLREYIAPK